MSNFQRTRSKVWWGDSPPNIGSPIAQASEWNGNNKPEEHDDKDWEPQLPQWIGEGPAQPTVNQESPKEPAANAWPHRHGSPGSHKSQDSGFSDSDSSPPTSQYYPSPEINNNKSSSSSDSNNENITVKHVVDFKETPKSTKKLQIPETASKPGGRLRSTSVIQTPYDFEKYIEIHGDEEHLERLKDPVEEPTKETPDINIPISVTPTDNVNSSKVSPKLLISNRKESSKDIKVAKVKDLETSKSKSEDSLEYIQVSEKDRIAVNNQPRIRSPISNVHYIPEPDYDNSETTRPAYNRSNSQQNQRKERLFCRDKLNKSLNYEAQKLDEQILDIQGGYRSLDYSQYSMKLNTIEVETKRGYKLRNVTDSLQFKPHKRYGPKNKYKATPKIKNGIYSYKPSPQKLGKPCVVDEFAGGILEGSRVPELGLPRFEECEQWIMVGHPEQESLIHNERLIGSKSETDLLKSKDLSKNTKNRNDINLNLKHDSKREKLKGSTESFNINLEFTSTPKMLAPHEYMFSVQATPQIPGKNSKLRRVNLMENFNGNSPPTSKARCQDNTEGTPLERISDQKPDSVQYWLCELVSSSENECMTTLQSKALGLEVTELVKSSSATITGNIKKVQTHGQIIVHQYSDILRQLEEPTTTCLDEPLCLLVANVNEFVLTHSISLNTRPPGETPERWDKIKEALQDYLRRLVEIGEDIKTEMAESERDSAVLRGLLRDLLDIFYETTKAVLVQQLKTLSSIIEEPPSEIILKSTLTSICHLSSKPEVGQLHSDCAHLASAVRDLPFVQTCVPRALLAAVIESDKNSVKALALRALATICVCAEAVEQFEEAGGLEIISDLLAERDVPEGVTREAVTVLTQATAAWRRGDPRALARYADTLVGSVTRVTSTTSCCQLLLLCMACLSNLVRALELDGDAGDACDLPGLLHKYRTVDKVLDAVKRRGPEVSVYLQEQCATLLSTLCRSARCLRAASASRAVGVALVCFTRAPHQERSDERERGAAERLLERTAEAISRLCVFPSFASELVQLEGVPRLIRLVETTRARHPARSDDVLVHCLRALRAVHRHCPHALDRQDAREMLDGHLMESVMRFTSKKESYV